jgi:large subunit ribosomal protein L4
MNAKIYNPDGSIKGEIALNDNTFNCEINEHLMYQVIKCYLANQRQGTAKTKGRSEVSGGGRKPWRQKHTGNARAGSNTSPIWVRGGKAFGPVPRDYYSKIPKKIKRKALVYALSSKAKEEKIAVVSGMSFEKPKTKNMAAILKALSLDNKKVLLLTENDKNLYMSARNIKNVTVKPISNINVYDILNNEVVLFSSENILKKLEEAIKL